MKRRSPVPKAHPCFRAFGAALALLATPLAASPTPAAPAAQWVTLGTSGGPAVHAERSQIANALVVGDAAYLFDAGNGVERQMAIAHIPERNLKAVFLTHHHLDHNASLGSIMVTHWTFYPGALTIIGPEGTRHLVEGLASANDPTVLAAFPTAGPAKPGIAAVVRATDLPYHLETPTLVFADAHVKVWAIGVDHFQVPPSVPLPRMPDAVAYRVEAGGRTFVYSGDTGPSARLVELARGADVFISEVVDTDAIAAQITATAARDTPAAVRNAIINGMSRDHLVPAEVGRIAAAAGVKSVVLTHFVPSPEQAKDIGEYTRDLKKIYHGKVTMARDLDRF